MLLGVLGEENQEKKKLLNKDMRLCDLLPRDAMDRTMWRRAMQRLDSL